MAFASRLPARTPMLVVIRDWRDVFADYDEARGVFEAISPDVAVVETDLRNTLGIDLTRVETLAGIGIAADGGGALAAIDATSFAMLVLDDPDTFTERVTEILAERPFDLDGRVDREPLGPATLLRFRRTDDSVPEAVVVVHPPLAYIFPDGDDPGIDAVAERLVGVAADPLSETPAFAASVAAANGHQFHGWFSPRLLATDQGADLEDRLQRRFDEEIDAAEIVAQIREVGDLTIALDLSPSGIRAHTRQFPTARVLEEFRMTTASATAPGFDRLVNADVYALLRLTVSAEHLYALFGEFGPPELRADADAEIERHRELLGMDPVTELLPAHGPNMMVLLTRARLLTLSRAINSGAPGELFNGLGVVIAVEVTDADEIRSALDTLVPQLEGRAELYEAGGNTVVEFTDARADIGNLVLTDRYLVLVPGRQRDELLSQVQTGEGSTLEAVDVDAARLLVTDDSANGLFIDMQRVVDGPIGQVALARLPDEVRRMLAQFARVTITVDATDDAVVGDLAIRFLANGGAP